MENLKWQISVSIFKNNIILKQLGIALGIPFGVLIIFFIIIKAYFGLLIIALLLASTWLFVMIVYQGSYDVEFVLDKKGVLCKTQEKQANKPTDNPHIESFNGSFRDECLNTN